MSGKYLVTLGQVEQLDQLFKGNFIMGHEGPRVAFVGRSNVGKSSLLNLLIGSQVAQMSRQPGKTRAIYFYFWEQGKKIFVDLPGYGFAKASKKDRESWNKLILAYLKKDPCVDHILLLLDSRHGPTASDEEAMQFLNLLSIPVTLVFTKVDQLKTQKQRASRYKEVSQKLLEMGFQSDRVYWVSSKTKAGVPELIKELKG